MSNHKPINANTFRIALIGVGLITQTAHLPAMCSIPELEIAGLLDANEGRARAVAEKFGLSDITITTDIQNIKGQVDAAVIATPNASHAELACRCLGMAMHVLVEKPLATCIEDAERVKSAAQSANRQVAVGFCMRHWPAIKRVKEMIQTEQFGKVKRFAFQYGAAGGWEPVSGYISKAQQVGGGVLVINGSHYLDRIIDWFGWPDEVSCEDDAYPGAPEANMVANFQYHGEPEINGLLRVSKTCSLLAGGAIEFEQGLLIVRDWKSPILEFKPNGIGESWRIESSDYAPETRPDMYRRQLIDFIQACRQNRPPMASLHDGVACLRLTEWLYSSCSHTAAKLSIGIKS